MLKSTFELLPDLLLAALTLLAGFCIVGSIVAALRAVNRESNTVIPKQMMEVYDFADATRMAAPTIFSTEDKLSEEMQYGWRKPQELERVGERRAGSKRSR